METSLPAPGILDDLDPLVAALCARGFTVYAPVLDHANPAR
jgi:hypothetical protein